MSNIFFQSISEFFQDPTKNKLVYTPHDKTRDEHTATLSKHKQRVIENIHGESCPICIETFKIGTIVVALPSCGHVFDYHCITQWKSHRAGNGTCPLCRA